MRSPSYREPSWSWASVDGGVSFEDISLKRKSGNWREKGTAWDTPGPNGRPVAKKIEISTIPLTKESDPYGQVIGGHIVLNGPLVVAKFPQCASSVKIEGYELLPRVEVMDEAAVFDTPSDNIGQERVRLPVVLKQTVYLVGTLSGLILSPCVGKDKWSFTRIGLFRCETESVTLAGGGKIYRPLVGGTISYLAEERFRRELGAWESLEHYTITIY